MFIHIQPDSSTPIYLQIVEQIKSAIASEVLRAGDQLPSVRSLARTLTINPNTVAKAYHELESNYIVKTHRGKGVFVATANKPLTEEEKYRLVGEKIDRALVEALNLNLSRRDVFKIVEERIEKFSPKLFEKE